MIKDLFRKEKGTLTPEQMARVNFIKDEADKFLRSITVGSENDRLNADQRCIDISIQKLEESVMWAVKGYTNINNNK